MPKTQISIKCKLWIDITANMFFARMPYILNEFEFVESETPNFYIFSNAKDRNLYGQCTKIYNPGENIPIDMNICHWAFGERYENEINHPNYMRLPNYTRLGAGTDLVKVKYNPQKILASKEKFCAFVYSNGVPFRNAFFKELSKYKKIDSPGAVLRNMPSIDTPGSLGKPYVYYDNKIKFLRKYKFAISFANECSPGYTSEKIYHAMLADCIPIYWGNPLVHKDFNPKSFINVHEFRSPKEAIDRVIELDKNDNLYIKYLTEPWYYHNIPTQYTDPNVILARFRRIFLEKK